MRILPIIARLIDQCALLEERVEPARSLTSLSDEEIAAGLPSAFVHTLKENANESNLVQKTMQRVMRRFCVIVAAANSDGVDEPLEDVREQIKTALTGWTPADGFDPVEYIEGEVIDVNTRMIWWRETYVTFNYNRS